MSLTIILILTLIVCVLGWVLKKRMHKRRSSNYKMSDQRTYCSGDLTPYAHLNTEYKPMYIIFNTSPQARKKQPE